MTTYLSRTTAQQHKRKQSEIFACTKKKFPLVSIGHPPLQFGQPSKFAPAGRAPRAQWKKKRIREQGVNKFLCQSVRLSARTAGSLFNLPATSVSSTFLRALRNLMCGAEFWSVLGLRATSHSSISSTATWMRHVLGPHVSCDEC